MYEVNIYLLCLLLGQLGLTMYFETFILTILFKNAKLNIKKKIKQTNKQTKKQSKFSKILGRSEKGKQTSFF